MLGRAAYKSVIATLQCKDSTVTFFTDNYSIHNCLRIFSPLIATLPVYTKNLMPILLTLNIREPYIKAFSEEAPKNVDLFCLLNLQCIVLLSIFIQILLYKQFTIATLLSLFQSPLCPSLQLMSSVFVLFTPHMMHYAYTEKHSFCLIL